MFVISYSDSAPGRRRAFSSAFWLADCGAESPAQPTAARRAGRRQHGFERVVLTAGRSTVLNTPFDVTRIAVTNPAVADAVVVQPREMLIDGKAPAPSA